jgi:hypothetical protein
MKPEQRVANQVIRTVTQQVSDPVNMQQNMKNKAPKLFRNSIKTVH